MTRNLPMLALRKSSSDWMRLKGQIKKLEPGQRISVVTPQPEEASILRERALAFADKAGMALEVHQVGSKLFIYRT